jgi:hypothetical protein
MNVGVLRQQAKILRAENNYDYKVEDRCRHLLLESAPLMLNWVESDCSEKGQGGMEEWAKEKLTEKVKNCDWYHGTWQFLRLLNMVATPPWYPFYIEALGNIMARHRAANVLVSAAADWGMVAQLHDAAVMVGARPTITLYDICQTPLTASRWYGDLHGFAVKCVCDNLITSEKIPSGAFDLIVTDEFLTVLKDELKPMITARWLELLKPGGSVVTTAMIGGPTTPDLRDGFARRAKARLCENEWVVVCTNIPESRLMANFDTFARMHTRHMLTSPAQLEALFAGFQLSYTIAVTPGECINPTNSFQIIATKPVRHGDV